MSAAPTESEDLLTVDQLAERTGVSVRTIRFYAGKGLIPAPRLRGRTGLYDAGHRARLELISELTGLGFTLAAIERQLERLPHDAGPEELALQRALLTPWIPESGEDLTRAELDRRAGHRLSDADVDTLAHLGALVRRDDGTVRVHGAIALATGLDALASGLPPELWQRAQAAIEKHTAALAEDLMSLFQDEVLQPYRDRGRPADERTRLAAALSRLKPVTVQGVVATFGRAVNRTIRERVGGTSQNG
ncbi:MerR family transcriptional regulator [Pseudonocardia sp. EC080610-09]|uniref:MerR family transcriptional regulator n=1 Tax=unclassified Pseudonocardia TaxID=2619320 RepID=UPI0006CB1C1A|nr:MULTISPECIES: MerR family transcriptional regulator [unclassified Pseudonocardia]ALE75125.1 MerR family transcriptional regulator [Pseudonocardia sp. EC080625-04]ALL74485.1 MerR family transcriptional regulator [Pseudonocardia sp. EC080610-09]ALL81505.1 MerR family transcriptional regulator [Pseudonocardia sp. EC080619-01]